MAIREKLVGDHPTQDPLQAQLAETYQNLGLVYAQQRRLAEAQAVYDKALRLLEPLAKRDPDSALSLSAVCMNMAGLAKATGKTAEALRLATRAVELADGAVQQEPTAVEPRERALNAHGVRAQVHELLGRWADAADDWDRVVALDHRPIAMHRLAQALARARAGRHARAVAAADELKHDGLADRNATYNLACVYALAATAARADQRLTAAERAPTAERYARQAMALLQQLEAAGYFRDAGTQQMLTADPDLAALHDRADWQPLVKRMRLTPSAKTP